MGPGLHKNALVPTPIFHAHEYLTCTRYSFNVHASPASLINAHPRNERIIFVCCTAQRFVCTSSAIHSSPRAQDHGAEGLPIFMLRVVIVCQTQNPTPAMLCRP